MILIHINKQYYLINDLMTRMAKDLPEGTLIFCIDEFFSGYPVIRLSTKDDHCFGCQPLIAVSNAIPNIKVSSEILSSYQKLPFLLCDIDLSDTELYTIEDIKNSYEAGENGKFNTLENHLNFMRAYHNIWNVKVFKDKKYYIVKEVEFLDVFGNNK